MAVREASLASANPVGRFRVELRRLFYGHRPAAVAFQAGLLALDLAALAYFLATTFVTEASWVRAVDLLLGFLLLLEFLGRLAAHRHPMHYLDNAAALIDIVVILSLFWSALIGNLAFLRVLRTARLLRSYNVLGRLKQLFPAVRRHEEVITAALDLVVFMLLVSSAVYVTQHATNPDIGHFLDALYFTVTTLSTTGFGDITLEGASGRLLSMGKLHTIKVGYDDAGRLLALDVQDLARQRRVHALRDHRADHHRPRSCSVRSASPRCPHRVELVALHEHRHRHCLPRPPALLDVEHDAVPTSSNSTARGGCVRGADEIHRRLASRRWRRPGGRWVIHRLVLETW